MPSALGQASGAFAQLNLHSSTWDILLLGFLLAVSAVYTILFVTRGKIIPMLLATYMAFVLLKYAPFPAVRDFPSDVLAFVLVFLLILFILSRVILQSPVGSETFGVVSSFVLALAQTGFLVAVLLTLLPPEIVRQFSQLAQLVFIGEAALFYWALAPVLLLLFIGRIANREVG